MMLCYYDAYCPLGVGSVPDGGYKEDVSWAPVLDAQNLWIGLSADAKCKGYTEIYPSEPAWGITGEDNEKVTRNVCCVKDPKFEMDAAATTAEEKPATSLLSHSSAAAGGQISIDVIKFHPVTFTRSQGWAGSTYGEALTFCALQESKIPCPFEAICPMASRGPPYGGVVGMLNSVWAPIIDSANSWVQIGGEDTCMKYIDMNPHPPMWGLTGKESEAITPIILCCKEQKEIELQDIEVAEVGQLNEREEAALLFQPVWFGRKVRVGCSNVENSTPVLASPTSLIAPFLFSARLPWDHSQRSSAILQFCWSHASLSSRGLLSERATRQQVIILTKRCLRGRAMGPRKHLR